MLQYAVRKHILKFKFDAGTSRGILREKFSWFIKLIDLETGKTGVGECSVIKGLSPDFDEDYEQKIISSCERLVEFGFQKDTPYKKWPSILFGIETAIADLNSENHILFPGDFTSGKKSIPINGLIWMGDESFMLKQIEEKIESGFKCLKMKIGAIDFETELKILGRIRSKYDSTQLQLRVDANGAFTPNEAMSKLEKLAQYNIHSIEQPINRGQWEAMSTLCKKSPLPIAIDEELIGIQSKAEKEKLLNTIKPTYVILKPSLHGGISGCEEWIELAEEKNIQWWVTSALESNVGLNAIAQWTATLNNEMFQGLGTGSLFENNFISPLEIENGELIYKPKKHWDLNLLYASAIS